MDIIDSHAHIDQVDDVEQAIRRAQACGVTAIIAVGMNLASNQRILEIAAAHKELVRPALGIHPWAIEESEIERTLEFIELHIGECVAIGEIGLDYWIKKDKSLQKTTFAALLDIAVRHGKPVSTHSRGSYEDVFRMVSDSGVKGAVFHWYSGPLEITREIAERGYYISATPAVQYSEKHRKVIQTVPLENLLLETDCPVKYNDIKSEPADVRVTLEEVAKLKDEKPDLVAKTTTSNSEILFRLIL